jgi:hypothetical protein
MIIVRQASSNARGKAGMSELGMTVGKKRGTPGYSRPAYIKGIGASMHAIR